LQDDNYSWKKLPAKDFRKLLENGYSKELSNYEFDKGDCINCKSNSSIYDLFADGNCGICQNMECLRYKQAEYMALETTRLMDEKKGMIAGICVAPNSFASAEVVGNLSDTGCEIYEMSATPMPVKPEKPQPNDFESDVEYLDAERSYGRSLEQHHAHTAQIEDMVQAGKAELMVDVSRRKPKLCYRVIPETAAAQTTEEDSVEGSVEKLRSQDRRNREIAFEKGVEEIKQLVRDKLFPQSEFLPLEEGLLYYVMLSSLRRENYESLGINNRYALSDEDKAGVIASLTDEQKNLIRRDFLVRHLSDTSGDRKQSHILIEFASLHFPGEVGQIKQRQNDVYKKRHVRIQERILALQPVAVGQAENVAVLTAELPAASVPAEEFVAVGSPETVGFEMTGNAVIDVVDVLPEQPENGKIVSIDGTVAEIQSAESISAGSWDEFVAETSNELDADDMALYREQFEQEATGVFAVTICGNNSAESDPVEEIVATGSEEAVDTGMLDEAEKDAIDLHPEKQEHAAIGKIPEEEEKLLDTVYYESDA
jgi:hypothetical protein